MPDGSATRNYIANPKDIPEGTLTRMFFEAIDAYGDAEAFRHKVSGEWRSLSYREVERRVRHTVLALDELGIQPRDRVAILSENRPEWALSDYATLCMGAWSVPIYPNLPPAQIAYILENSGARLIFVSTAEQLAKVDEIRAGLPELRRVVVYDDVDHGGADVLTWNELQAMGAKAAEDGRDAGFRERALRAEPEDIATVLYTSGTTGQPKGVMLTHNNIASNVRATTMVIQVGPGDVGLSLLPLSHIFERMVDYLFFWRGIPVVYAESIDAVPRNLLEVRPTVVASVPRLYEKIYERVKSTGGLKRHLIAWASAVGEEFITERLAGRTPGAFLRFRYGLADRLVFRKLRERTGGRLRFFVSGGAPLEPKLARFFYSAGILILEGYGLTETSPVTNVNTPEAFRFGTVGRPIPGTEVFIADDGEILIRGPQVMKGYYNDPRATAEAIDEDGWFHTGDIGEIDADGYLRITDRKKDIIVTAGGKNIAPQPIENRIKSNRYVAEAVMLGNRRPYPVVLVVPNFQTLEEWAAANGIEAADRSALVRDERVRRHMEREVFGMVSDLARFEQPKRIALLDREFTIQGGELTPTLKVRRREVEERFRDVIEALYAEPQFVPAE